MPSLDSEFAVVKVDCFWSKIAPTSANFRPNCIDTVTPSNQQLLIYFEHLTRVARVGKVQKSAFSPAISAALDIWRDCISGIFDAFVWGYDPLCSWNGV